MNNTNLNNHRFGIIRDSVSELPRDYQYNCMDVIKFICAILVTMIHIVPFSVQIIPFAEELNFAFKFYICRLAVPYFFVCSGFLLFRKIKLNNINMGCIKSYCFKILRLLGTWSFLLFLGDNSLWYLGAVVIAVVMLAFMLKYKWKIGFIVAVSVFLYIIGVLGDSYYSIIEPLRNFFPINYISFIYDNTYGTTRNGVFFGLLFILMGAIFAHYKIHMKIRIALVGFVLSMVLLYFEVYTVKDYSIPKSMYFSLVPALFFLFYITVHISLRNNSVFSVLRVISSLIFYMHWFVNYFVVLFIRFLFNSYSIDLRSYEYIITMLILIIIARLIEKVSHVNGFRWLRFLYT